MSQRQPAGNYPRRKPGNTPSHSRRKPVRRAGGPSRPSPRPRPKPADKGAFRVLERNVAPEPEPDAPVPLGPFRVVVAVHRPRFRGRTERACAFEGWDVTALLNKQDVVGLVGKGPRPPDLLILSGDFGRQKDYAIFRAVQKWREQGMTIIGMVEDCDDAPEGFPDSPPAKLCDICLPPPYKTADLRSLFAEQYETKRGRPAPPLRTKGAEAEEEEDD